MRVLRARFHGGAKRRRNPKGRRNPPPPRRPASGALQIAKARTRYGAARRPELAAKWRYGAPLCPVVEGDSLAAFAAKRAAPIAE